MPLESGPPWNTILLPSGEKDGLWERPRPEVRRTASPPATCCIQISVVPLCERSDEYAITLPSGEIAGATFEAVSEVMRRKV